MLAAGIGLLKEIVEALCALPFPEAHAAGSAMRNAKRRKLLSCSASCYAAYAQTGALPEEGCALLQTIRSSYTVHVQSCLLIRLNKKAVTVHQPWRSHWRWWLSSLALPKTCQSLLFLMADMLCTGLSCLKLPC